MTDTPTDDLFNTRAGYVAHCVTPAGMVHAMYRAAEAGLDAEGARFAVSCETHGTLVGLDSEDRAREHMTDDGAEWCDACTAEMAVRAFRELLTDRPFTETELDRLLDAVNFGLRHRVRGGGIRPMRRLTASDRIVSESSHAIQQIARQLDDAALRLGRD